MSKPSEYHFEDIKFGQKTSAYPARYEGYTVSSRYVAMKDGVRLAVDIYLPKGLVLGERLPTLIYRTRYWRVAELRGQDAVQNPGAAFFTSYGYAVVSVDVRGTGASFGSVLHEWQAQDIRDTYELVDWIIAQEWSDGKVGAYGVSYPGTTAALLAATGHPAVTSIWATYFELDGYDDIALPGGIPSIFLQVWSDFTSALDHNHMPEADESVIGVKPVEEDGDRSLLKAALVEHEQNHPVAGLFKGNVFRDDPMQGTGLSAEEMMVYPRRPVIEASGVPLDIWGSWMDANTPNTVIRFFNTFRNPLRGVISAWSHGGGSLHDPFLPPEAALEIDRESQMLEIKRPMDQHFHGISGGLPERILFYYTLGEGKWKSTTAWPLPGIIHQRLYLDHGHHLSQKPPASQTGCDAYQVDFSATTGKQNRWWTELGGTPILYGDRAEADRKLLVYDSEPLEQDTEITGTPLVTLYLSSSEPDGGLFIYLEDVDAQGKVTYLTEGLLRLLHRKVCDERPPFIMDGPYHSFKRKDALPLVPGEIAEIKMALIPVSALVRAGHRIRIAIAGADQDTFQRIPEAGEPLLALQRNAQHASWLDLPVVRR